MFEIEKILEFLITCAIRLYKLIMFISFGYLQKLVIYKKKEYNLIASIVQYNELSKAKCILCHYTVRTVNTIDCTV